MTTDSERACSLIGIVLGMFIGALPTFVLWKWSASKQADPVMIEEMSGAIVKSRANEWDKRLDQHYREIVEAAARISKLEDRVKEHDEDLERKRERLATQFEWIIELQDKLKKRAEE